MKHIYTLTEIIRKHSVMHTCIEILTHTTHMYGNTQLNTRGVLTCLETLTHTHAWIHILRSYTI